MINHIKPKSNIPGFTELNTCLKLYSGNSSIEEIFSGIHIIEEALSIKSCNDIIELFDSLNVATPVSVHGIESEHTYGKGSDRTTAWSLSLASELTPLIVPHLPQEMVCDDFTPTDWYQNNSDMNNVWIPYEISPMLRYMSYSEGSEHYAHYDAGYIYPGGEYRTLKSVVIYLTTNSVGSTRFIEDNQDHLIVKDRNHNDWTSPVTDVSLVKYSSLPVAGKVLVFDHRLCHDVEKFTVSNGRRIIIRTDVIYRKKI